MQGQSVFAAGSAELLSGTIANTTISYRLTADGTLTIYSDNIEKMPNYTVNSTVPWAAQKDKIKSKRSIGGTLVDLPIFLDN